MLTYKAYRYRIYLPEVNATLNILREGTRVTLEKAKLSSQEIVPLIYQKTYDINKNSVDSSAESVDRVSVVAR